MTIKNSIYYGSIGNIEIYTFNKETFDLFKKINQNRNDLKIKQINNPTQIQINKAIKYDKDALNKLNEKCYCDS